MDSDDISLPNRCELQLKQFDKNKKLSLCSGSIAEFESIPEKYSNIRRLPKEYKEIYKFAKRRNPMNHMAVMFSKAKVIESGGYIDIKWAEDYYLWVRMLCNGGIAENIDSILVYARVGNGMYARRGGINYARNIYKLQKEFLKLGFVTRIEFFQNCVIRIVIGLIPTQLRKWFYKNCLRSL